MTANSDSELSVAKKRANCGHVGRSFEYPVPLDEGTARRMRAVPQRDTAPELAIRSALHQMGLRFFVNRITVAGLRRRSDLIFPSARVAVFIDGCFWHGCPVHVTWPRNNGAYWREKIERNRQRDTDTNRCLSEAGWLAVRVWTHEDIAEAAERIATVVRARK